MLGGALAVLGVFVFLCDAKLWRPAEVFTIKENIQIAEAQAWWQGRLDLPERKWDSALFNGKVYSHFPPMFTFLSFVVVRLADGVPHWLVTFLIVLPAVFLSYVLFLRLTGSPFWGTVGALGLIVGTSALPVLENTLRGARPYSVNQTLALAGVLAFLIEFFGRRRVFPLAATLAVMAWSRQLTLVYALPLIWAAHDRDRATRGRSARLAAGLFIAAVIAVPLAINFLKFENPLDSGYMHIYTDRPEDAFSRDARAHGLFSPHFVPRNLYYANLGLPDADWITREGRRELYLRPNQWGTGIWWTTPMLLWLLVFLPQIWADPARRALLLAALLANLALLFYHSTGYQQRGFNRYSLDYLPVLLVLVAPACFVGWRRWVTLGMVAWSAVYFAWLIRLPHLRVC